MSKIITVIFILFSGIVYSQTLPSNMDFNASDHLLNFSGVEAMGFYDETSLESIYLDFYDSNYWSLLQENYNTEVYVPAKLTYKGEIFDSVGIQFKGQTSYTNAVKSGERRLSFSIKLNHFVNGANIDGYNNLNLNNAYEDPSYLKEVVYAHLARKHIPAVRGNFVKLYLNNLFWGVYPNVQQINGDFLKEWFLTNNGILWRADSDQSNIEKIANEPPGGGGGGGGQWGDGTAALNYLGDDSIQYQKYYTLKSSEYENPWEYLVTVCDKLNNTALDVLADTIRNYINLDATLWLLATETLFSDDDSYVHKGKMDYYLYFDDETGLIQPVEFDGNSAMDDKNVNWDLFYNENKVNYPLMNRLFQVPEIRQRYLAYVRTILNDAFDTDYTSKLIDAYDELIDESVKTETVKLYTYAKHKTNIEELKSFIITRKNYLYTNKELDVASPKISTIKCITPDGNWGYLYNNEEITFSVNATHVVGIKQVNLYVSKQLFGNFEKHEMEVNAGTYNYTLSNVGDGNYLRFYFEAVANNGANTRSYEPAGAEHQTYFIEIQTPSVESDVVINEIVASNESIVTDSEGEYEDYIELYNNANNLIDLTGYYLSDKSDNLTKFELQAGTVIEPNDYLTIWADEDGSQKGLHANFKLSKEGETIYLITPQVQIADQVEYSKAETNVSYARVPNGTGEFVWQEATVNSINEPSASLDYEIDGNSLLRVYPNPANNYINIVCDDNIDVCVYNSQGTTAIQKQIVSKGISHIDISSLNSGIYYVVINSIKSRYTQKLVVN